MNQQMEVEAIDGLMKLDQPATADLLCPAGRLHLRHSPAERFDPLCAFSRLIVQEPLHFLAR